MYPTARRPQRRRPATGPNQPCPPSPSTTSPSCRGSPTRTRSRPASAPCAASRAPRAGSRARASPSAAPSPASTSPTSTRSSTWTRWARWSTRPGEPKGTPWHPHRGFETVTYMMDGTFEHSDSNGGGGVITNGDTQWMTAGAGILHIEKPPEALVVSGGLFHGIQLWVNLPRDLKWSRAALPGPAGAGGRARLVGRRRRARPGHRRRGRRARRPGLDVHADDAGPRHAEPRRPALAARGGPTTTRSSTSSPGTAPSGRERRPIADRPARRLRPGRRAHRRRRRRSRRAGARTSTCWSSAAARSASRSPGWGPSS